MGLAHANPLRNEFILGNIKVYLRVLTLFGIVAQIVYIHFIEDKGIFILHDQYHRYWWGGVWKIQAMSSHNINFIFSECFDISTTRVKLD